MRGGDRKRLSSTPVLIPHPVDTVVVARSSRRSLASSRHRGAAGREDASDYRTFWECDSRYPERPDTPAVRSGPSAHLGTGVENGRVGRHHFGWGGVEKGRRAWPGHRADRKGMGVSRRDDCRFGVVVSPRMRRAATVHPDRRRTKSIAHLRARHCFLDRLWLHDHLPALVGRWGDVLDRIVSVLHIARVVVAVFGVHGWSKGNAGESGGATGRAMKVAK